MTKIEAKIYPEYASEFWKNQSFRLKLFYEVIYKNFLPISWTDIRYKEYEPVKFVREALIALADEK
jgi:hypothetical protein